MKRPFHHGDLRNALITAAKELIERKGSQAFALREAARNVGVSANAAYNHFEDKDALLRAVASSGFAELAVQREKARLKLLLELAKQAEALDNLVSSGKLTPQRRAGAESTLWSLLHGLALLRRAGALREPFDVSWKRMLTFTANGLGVNLDEQRSK